MGDVLTWDEIERRYPDEWVLLGAPQTKDTMDVVGGKVVFHSKLREDVYDEALTRKLPVFAVLFTGQPDPDLAFLF